jgi:hypothetical protein
VLILLYVSLLLCPHFISSSHIPILHLKPSQNLHERCLNNLSTLTTFSAAAVSDINSLPTKCHPPFKPNIPMSQSPGCSTTVDPIVFVPSPLTLLHLFLAANTHSTSQTVSKSQATLNLLPSQISLYHWRLQHQLFANKTFSSLQAQYSNVPIPQLLNNSQSYC